MEPPKLTELCLPSFSAKVHHTLLLPSPFVRGDTGGPPQPHHDLRAAHAGMPKHTPILRDI